MKFRLVHRLQRPATNRSGQSTAPADDPADAVGSSVRVRAQANACAEAPARNPPALPSDRARAQIARSRAGHALFVTDCDGVITAWSEGARRLYGYEPDEMVGHPVGALGAAGELLAGVTAEIIKRVRQDGSWAGSVRHVKRNGAAFTAQVSVSPLLGYGDSEDGFLFVTSDDSELERLTGELQREQEARRLLFEASADAMLTVGNDGTIQQANGAALRLFGYGARELVGQPVEMLMPVWVRRQHVEDRAAFAASPQARPMAAGLELVGLRKDGTEFPLEIRLTPHESASGPVVRAEIRDVSEQRRVEQELADAHRQAVESLALLESLYSAAPIGLAFVDRDLQIAHVNTRLAAIYGSDPLDLFGRTVAEAVPQLWPRVQPHFEQVLRTGRPVVNSAAQGLDASRPGSLRSWLSSYYPVTVDGRVIGIGHAVLDVTEIRRADDLRTAVMQNMGEGLCVIDADGRLVLMNTACSEMLGWTQDELLGKSVHDAIHFQHADGTPYPAAECKFRELCVEGVSTIVGEDCFTAKDGRLVPVSYSASPLVDGSASRGVVVVFRDMSKEHAERERARREEELLVWVGRTRDALDEGRLVLHAQPIVPLAGGRPFIELLVRMIGNHGELVAPSKFLPAAEQFGLIVDIDRWVIGQAIRVAAQGVAVHVNVSARSVADRSLLTEIEHQIQGWDADPENLVFELTETALMDDISHGNRFVQGLSKLGCAIAVDDFGTGFGSFTYLKRLKVNIIKIDIEFVRKLTTNTSDQYLVKAIVNLAAEFGQTTVAEGVEDAETLELLRLYGVDYAQGFYLGRPEPIERPTGAA